MAVTKWYSLRVISGKEKKIKERIEREIARNNWEDHVMKIVVPTEKVYKIRGGKKVISDRNILPGYILVEADPYALNGQVLDGITGLPNVIDFLGKNEPIPMRDSEANRLLGKVDENLEAGDSLIEPFIEGETVKIIDGPFNEFVGDIQEVNEEKKKLKVIVKDLWPWHGSRVELHAGRKTELNESSGLPPPFTPPKEFKSKRRRGRYLQISPLVSTTQISYHG